MFKISKYLAITKNAFITNLEYRGRLVLWSILAIFPTSVMIITWQQIMNQSINFDNNQLAQITQYYLLIMFISQLGATYLEQWITKRIKKGELNFFLLRPISFHKYLLFDLIGRKFNYLIIFLPIWLGFYFFVSNIINVTINPDLFTWFQFLMLIIFNLAIEFSLSLIIINIGFWVEESGGLIHFKQMIIALFSGAMMPLKFLPKWLQIISEVLPFKYMYYTPVMLIQQRTYLTINDVAQMLASLLFLFILVKVLWKMAVKRYSSVGG